MRNSNIPRRSPALNLSQQGYQPSYPMSLSQQLTPSSQLGYPGGQIGYTGGQMGYPGYPGMDYQKQSYIEQIPYEKKTVDYYPEEKIEYIPQEQKYQDYLEVQHELDYVPVPRLEKYTDHVPLERYDTYYDYMPRQNTVVRSTGSNYVPPANQYPNAYPSYSYGPQSYGYGPYSYGSQYGPMRRPPTYGGYPMSQAMPQAMPYRPFSANKVPPYYPATPYSGYPSTSPYSGYSRYKYL